MPIDGTAPNIHPTFKDPKMYTDEEKKMIKLDKPTWSLLIQRLGNDSYSLIDSNKTTKELWDALERQMRGFEYGEQDRKAPVLYEYETFKANEGGKHFDTYLRFLQVINDLKKYGFEKDNCELNYKFLSNFSSNGRNTVGVKSKDVVVSYELSLVAKKKKDSTCLGLRMMSRLSLKNDIVRNREKTRSLPKL
ncbi:hypothetical protein Tco_0276167 [Tanacetum coccineum]